MERELENDLKNLEITELKERAENLVALGAVATAATGVAPLPFSDAPLLITEQVALMAKICDIFGIDVDKDGLKMLVTTALSTGGATLVGKTIVANLLKFFPGPGTAAGAAISATTAGAVTLAMGKAFIMVCQAVKLGKLSKADLTSETGAEFMKEKFKEQIKKENPKEFI